MNFIPLALTLMAGGASAIQQRNAGVIASNEAQGQARVEASAAKQKEIERRRALVRSLASQNAFAGAGGAEFSGSIAGIARADIRDAQNDLLVDSANATATQRALDERARNARRQGNLGAAISLIDTAGKVLKPRRKS